jgi:hypothetical protein
MSFQAVAWAIEQQEVKQAVTRFVLIVLSSYAGADGKSAFPSVTRLCRDTGLSERAVRQHLRKLELSMLIRRSGIATHISRVDRRPVCYEVMMKPRGAPYAPRESTGCTIVHNGVHMTTERGAPRAPDPVREQSLNSKRKSLLKEVLQENLKKHTPTQLLAMSDEELGSLAKP